MSATTPCATAYSLYALRSLAVRSAACFGALGEETTVSRACARTVKHTITITSDDEHMSALVPTRILTFILTAPTYPGDFVWISCAQPCRTRSRMTRSPAP